MKSELRLPLNTEIPNATIHYEDKSSKKIVEKLRSDIREAGKVKHVKILRKTEKTA